MNVRLLWIHLTCNSPWAAPHVALTTRRWCARKWRRSTECVRVKGKAALAQDNITGPPSWFSISPNNAASLMGRSQLCLLSLFWHTHILLQFHLKTWFIFICICYFFQLGEQQRLKEINTELSSAEWPVSVIQTPKWNITVMYPIKYA